MVYSEIFYGKQSSNRQNSRIVAEKCIIYIHKKGRLIYFRVLAIFIFMILC